MGVYIKGMKMPDKATTIVVFPEGKARVFRQDIDHDEWLTAIEVPPHGRLIDADAINYEDEIWKKKCIPPLMVYNAWLIAGEMTTIIEAEDGT